MKSDNETKSRKPDYQLVMWGFIALAALWWISIIAAKRLDRYHVVVAIADTVLAAGFVLLARRR